MAFGRSREVPGGSRELPRGSEKDWQSPVEHRTPRIALEGLRSSRSGGVFQLTK
jgi:hypothetical protein